MPKGGQFRDRKSLKTGNGAGTAVEEVVEEKVLVEQGGFFGSQTVAVTAVEGGKSAGEITELGRRGGGKAQAGPETDFAGFLADEVFTGKGTAVAFIVQGNTDFNRFLSGGLPTGVVFGEKDLAKEKVLGAAFAHDRPKTGERVGIAKILVGF